MKGKLILLLCLTVSIYTRAQQHRGDPALTEVWNPVPKVITPGLTSTDASSDAVVLFKSEKDTVNWVSKDGKPFNRKAGADYFTVVPFSGDLRTKQAFGDCQLPNGKANQERLKN